MPNGSTVFVDTNVLLYAVDPRDAKKRSGATAWLERCWRDRCGRLSTQVLNELYVNLRRVAPGLERKDARDLVQRYRAWSPWLVDDVTVDIAWTLEDRLAISYWDALMVAAAQQQGCDFLLTENLQHDRAIDGLRVVNPFRAAPSLLDSTS